MTPTEKKKIRSIARIVRTHYCHDSAHDWSHITRVWSLAKVLAKDTSANAFLIEVAALIHDVDDHKFTSEDEPAFSNTIKIMQDLKMPERVIDQVLAIVSRVSYTKNRHTSQSTLEGQIVQDADRLDALGAIGIARTFMYSGSKNKPLYVDIKDFGSEKNKNAAVFHFYEKLLKLTQFLNTEKAKKIAQKRHQLLKTFLHEFQRELNENNLV